MAQLWSYRVTQETQSYANSMTCPDSDRLEILRGALAVLLEDLK
jgi:hypothetical protein